MTDPTIALYHEPLHYTQGDRWGAQMRRGHTGEQSNPCMVDVTSSRLVAAPADWLTG
jgi:hypothetical protein